MKPAAAGDIAGHGAEAMPPGAEPPLSPLSPQRNGFGSALDGGGSVGGDGDGITAAKGSQQPGSPQSPRSPLVRRKVCHRVVPCSRWQQHQKLCFICTRNRGAQQYA